MNHAGPTPKVYALIWGALMILLALTWSVARFNLGHWNIIAAMTISVLKMLLVMLFFMHLRYSVRLSWIFAIAGFFWLFFMITLVLMDYVTRGGLRL